MDATQKKILLVDDNPRVRSFVRPALEEAGFECVEAVDGWSALEMMDSETPDLVVLDILLGDEDMTGLDVCKQIRQKGILTPVVFLTIKDRATDPRYMEQAFNLGGDDYVSKREELRQIEESLGLKPTEFLERKSDVDELVARVRARLPQADFIDGFDGLVRVDVARQRAQFNGDDGWQDVRLTAKEFTLLQFLAKSGGRPVGKGQLMDVADIDGESSLQNHIWRLRSKLEPKPDIPRYILTYHKIGYRFRTED